MYFVFPLWSYIISILCKTIEEEEHHRFIVNECCHQCAGAPGIPLPGAGTSTAFLSSVRPTHCSTSRASRSTSSSDFSVNHSRESTPWFHHIWSEWLCEVQPDLLIIFVICSSRYSRRLMRASDQRSRTQFRSSSCSERTQTSQHNSDDRMRCDRLNFKDSISH